MDVSSVASSAYAAKLGQTQYGVGVALFGQQLKSQQEAVTTLLGSGGGSGGMVTESRGQNVNITV